MAKQKQLNNREEIGERLLRAIAVLFEHSNKKSNNENDEWWEKVTEEYVNKINNDGNQGE